MSSRTHWLALAARVLVMFVLVLAFANDVVAAGAAGATNTAGAPDATFEMFTHGDVYAPSTNLSLESPTLRRGRSVLQRRQFGADDGGGPTGTTTSLAVAAAGAGGSGSGSSSSTCSRTDGDCMLVLYCVISGGQTGGRCGGSIFYACCYKPVTTRSSPNFDLGSVLGSANALPMAGFGAPGVETERAIESGFDDNAVCGQTSSHKKLQRRIIGGDDANFGEFPWQAHIKIGRQQCGGALVSHNYVLTAAHCVHLNPLRRITVVLGAYDIQSTRYARSASARTYRIVQKKIHPNFAFSASQPDRFDVALLRLDQHVQYQENILPVCLPPRGWTFEGWRATVTGWGKTDASLNNRYGTRVLQKVQVPIITRQECEKWHQLRGIHIKIYPEMMCAGYKEGKRDACVGDSGGPMTLFLNGRWTIVGITSAGFGCAQSHQPGIYHQVSVSVDWILANL